MVKTQKPKNPFELVTNILNIYIYNLDKLKQDPGVQIYNFWGLVWPLKWVLGFLP
jgi:hypothetical protein